MSSDSQTEPLFSNESFDDVINLINQDDWRTFSDGLIDDPDTGNEAQTLEAFTTPPLLRRCSTDLTPMPVDEPGPEQLQAVLSQPPPASALPVLESWPGRHQFRVSVRTPRAAARQAPYVFSPGSDKLYTDIMVAVPFSFHATTAGADEGTLRIRALPVYKDAHHQHEPVRRCPTHREVTHPSNEGETELLHVVRAQHPQASYKSVEERRSVTVPYERPEAGTEDYMVPFKFTCMNTCVGGINRRRLAIVFTLENRSTGEVLGRQSLEVKVCRCPHRDWRTDEKRRGSADGQSRATKRRLESPASAQPSGKWVVQADDEEMYEFLQDQRRVLLRMRQRRGSADDAPAPLARQPTTPIKAEYIVFE